MLWIIPVTIAALAAYYFFPEKKLPAGQTVDRLVVLKSARKMEAWSGNELLKTYTVSLGKSPIG